MFSHFTNSTGTVGEVRASEYAFRPLNYKIPRWIVKRQIHMHRFLSANVVDAKSQHISRAMCDLNPLPVLTS